MRDYISAAARRIGAGATAFLVAKIGMPPEAAQQIVIAGGVFLGLAIDAAIAAFVMRRQ